VATRQRRIWTDDEVAQLMALAYASGACAERTRIADRHEELDATWRQAATPYEDQVAARIATFTPAEGTVEAWMAGNAQRQRTHDEALDLETANTTPITSLRDIHASSTPSAWSRIWWEQTAATQAELSDLAPAGAGSRVAAAYMDSLLTTAAEAT
jgi:hypothetical protein